MFIGATLAIGALAASAGALLREAAVGGVETAATGTIAAQGLIATIDPRTGEVAVGAATAKLPASPAATAAFRTDSAGLTEVQLPGGQGVKLDLQGRFRSPLVARVDADGAVRVTHPHPFATDINR
jgi:hypothetical protein